METSAWHSELSRYVGQPKSLYHCLQFLCGSQLIAEFSKIEERDYNLFKVSVRLHSKNGNMMYDGAQLPFSYIALSPNFVSLGTLSGMDTKSTNNSVHQFGSNHGITSAECLFSLLRCFRHGSLPPSMPACSPSSRMSK